jgi:hypothetical protein
MGVYRIHLQKGTFYIEEGKTFIRLTSPGVHGDWKDTRRGELPPGDYKVLNVWSNLYGQWIRVKYKDNYYDIAPNQFEMVPKKEEL